MASTIELEATARPAVGKGAARQARREGMVPGVVYGGNEEPATINIRHNVLLKALKAGKFMQSLVKLNIDGKEQTVICRGVQRDVVKDLPVHADFLRLSEKSVVELSIPVHFTGHGASPGIKRGGVLTVVRAEVELKVLAANIPDELVADLSGLDVNDVIRISDITLPEGARPVITDRDFMIANISAPTVLKAEGDEDEEGTVTPARVGDEDEDEGEE